MSDQSMVPIFKRALALESDLALERAAWLAALKEHNDSLREVCRERDQIKARVFELEDEVAKQRARAELAEAEVSKLGSQAFAYRMRAYGAEARVRELEARPPRLPEVEPQFPEPEVDEDPPDPAKTSPI